MCSALSELMKNVNVTGVKVLNSIMLILTLKAEVRPSLTSTEVRCAPVLRESVEFKAPW